MALIQNPFDTQKGAAPQRQANGNFGAQTYQAVGRSVDDRGLVQNQVNSILSKDGEMMQRARTQAKEQMNGRGLVNSSMAIEAAQAAVMDKALPIAQQDAGAWNQADSDNMSAYNSAGQFNANANNQFGLQDNDHRFTASENSLNRAATAAEGAANRSHASSENALGRTFTASESALMRTFNSGQNALDRTATSNLQTNQQTFTAGENALDRTANSNIETGRQTFTAGQNALDRTATSNLQTNQQTFTAGQNTLDRNVTTSEGALTRAFTATQNQLTRDADKANVPQNISTGIISSTFSQVQTIISDPNLTPEAKKAAIENATTYANSTLTAVGRFYGTPAQSMPTSAVPLPATAPATAPAPAPAPRTPPPAVVEAGGWYDRN